MKKITVLDKFIFSQVFQATLVCLFLFIIVWIAPETLVRIIRKIFIKHIPVVMALKLLFYEMPKVLDKALPVGILLGSIFTFNKLSKDSELVILRSIGISFNRIMASVILLGCVFASMCFFVGDRLVPWASESVGENAYFDKHFVYVKKDDLGRPKQSVIISNHTPNQLRKLIIINFSPDVYDDVTKFKSILFADYALKLDDKWILPKAKEYTISDLGVYESVKTVNNCELLKGSEADDVWELMIGNTKRDRSFTNTQMAKYIKLLDKYGYDDERNYFKAKLYQRFLHPLSCILFSIIGCLLGFTPPRSQKMIGFIVAVGIIFAYYITIPFFDVIAQKGAMPPLITASIPFLTFIGIIFAIKKIRDL